MGFQIANNKNYGTVYVDIRVSQIEIEKYRKTKKQLDSLIIY